MHDDDGHDDAAHDSSGRVTGHSGADHTHDDGHGHSHGAHGHSHAPKDFGRAFAIGIGLNTAFIVIEFFYGIVANSMALIADAGHNLSDVLGLVLAWIATILVRRPPSPRYSYGLKGSSILAALSNAVILLIAVGAIALEAVQRFFKPEDVAGSTVMAVAAIGIVINGVTAWLFSSGSKDDINIRGAYLHMAADAAVSAGVVLAGLLIMLTDWRWIDPLVSLAIVAIIVWSTWGLLKESLAMSMNAVPAGIDAGAVKRHLAEQPGVDQIHDLHIWSMSTTEVALTAHLVMSGGHPGDVYLMRVTRELHDTFGIAHSTLQIETDASTECALAPDHVV